MKYNACIVAPPFDQIGALAQVTDLSNLISKNSNKTFLITGSALNVELHENVRFIPIDMEYMKENNIFITLLKFFRFNWIVSKEIFRLRKHFKTAVFYNSNHIFVLLLTKFLRKRVVVAVLGDLKQCSYMWYQEKFFGIGGYLASFFFGILRKISFMLSDIIVLEYENQISELTRKFNNKAKVAPIRYINSNIFSIKKPYKERNSTICYVGRLTHEKGVLNLVESLPDVLKEYNDLKVILIGGGPLENVIKDKIRQMKLKRSVDLVGWVSHDILPELLNEMKLVVVPSYTEGLPGVVLESMSCGVPVLANNVGGIGSIIKDDETGFIMEDNSPKTITKELLRVLKLSESEKEIIVNNAYKKVIADYSRNSVLKCWEQVL